MTVDPMKLPTVPEINHLSERFKRFAHQECCDSSPLYDRLAIAVADDKELLAIASCVLPGQPVPNLFFASVQYLLFQYPSDPLAKYFPSLHNPPQLNGDLRSDFRKFCLSHKAKLQDLLGSKLVQTNEVRRSACFLPALQMVYVEANEMPLYLIDIGASAGLNLLFDQYYFDYGHGLTIGNFDSKVHIACQSRGAPIPLAKEFPAIASRVAIDLNPINVNESEDILWLKALIWPEHEERRKLLDVAVSVAKLNPIRHIRGDGVTTLSTLLDEALPGTIPCVIHSFTINQMPPPAVQSLGTVMAEFSKSRPLYCVAIPCKEGLSSNLEFSHYQNGMKNSKTLAKCSDHGTWIEWS